MSYPGLLARRVLCSGSSFSPLSPAAAPATTTSPSSVSSSTRKVIQTSYFSDQLISHKSIHTMAAGSRIMKIAALGATIGATSALYTGYVSYNRLQTMHQSAGKELKVDDMRLPQMPNIKPTSRHTGPTKLGFELTLFQYCSCPFCCKARTFLDYFGVDYNVVEVNPVLRKELKWSTNYRKVPILLAHSSGDQGGDQVYQLNDSSVIISSLGSCLMSRPETTTTTTTTGASHARSGSIEQLGEILASYRPMESVDAAGKKQSDVPNKYFLMLGELGPQELAKREQALAEERQWREWTDQVLVHSLSPNIYRTLPEALQAFDNFSAMGEWPKHFGTFERLTAVYAGSAAMWLIGRRLKRKYNLKEDVRESLYDNCRQWLKAVGSGRKFMGGDRPNLADLSVYGVLSSIEGCAAFRDLLANTNIEPWYYGVQECCRKHVGQQLLPPPPSPRPSP